jgi:hypothetical protein
MSYDDFCLTGRLEDPHSDLNKTSAVVDALQNGLVKSLINDSNKFIVLHDIMLDNGTGQSNQACRIQFITSLIFGLNALTLCVGLSSNSRPRSPYGCLHAPILFVVAGRTCPHE